MAKRKKQQPAATPAPESVFHLSINGHTLSGTRINGEWSFECALWPEIAQKWHGDTISDNAVNEFMGRALAGAVTVRDLASGKK